MSEQPGSSAGGGGRDRESHPSFLPTGSAGKKKAKKRPAEDAREGPEEPGKRQTEGAALAAEMGRRVDDLFEEMKGKVWESLSSELASLFRRSRELQDEAEDMVLQGMAKEAAKRFKKHD